MKRQIDMNSLSTQCCDENNSQVEEVRRQFKYFYNIICVSVSNDCRNLKQDILSSLGMNQQI